MYKLTFWLHINSTIWEIMFKYD